jgi:hypothetical protein
MLNSTEEDMAEKMQALALERGESDKKVTSGPLSIFEKEVKSLPKAPGLKGSSDSVEGHRPRKVRFE